MLKNIENLSLNIENFSKSLEQSFSQLEIEKLYSELDEFFISFVSDKYIPENVRNCVVNENLESTLLQEYPIFSQITNLKIQIRLCLEKQILQELKNNNFEKVAECLLFAMKLDIKYVVLFGCIENDYKENKLYKELIELYRTAFIYTTDPVNLEKIGDIQAILKNYNEAIDSYLSFAEINGPTTNIYDKLANLFEKINDESSKLACIEQKKMLEDADV